MAKPTKQTGRELGVRQPDGTLKDAGIWAILLGKDDQDTYDIRDPKAIKARQSKRDR